MATRKLEETAWNSESPVPADYEKITSVSAHMVRSIAVQMSVTEMETLIESFGVSHYDLTDTQKAIHREFADAVHSLR